LFPGFPAIRGAVDTVAACFGAVGRLLTEAAMELVGEVETAAGN